MTRKMDQLREGRRGFQARADLGMPMYSKGRRTAGIPRETGLGFVAALLAVAVVVEAVVEEEVDAAAAGVAEVAGFGFELDDGVGGVELIVLYYCGCVGLPLIVEEEKEERTLLSHQL